MAFVVIAATDVDAQSPVSDALMGNIKGDLDALLAAIYNRIQFQSFSTAGATTFDVPAGVTNMIFELVGGGTNGTAGTGGTNAGAGAGGAGGNAGGVLRKSITVTAGETLSLVVGAVNTASTISGSFGALTTASITPSSSLFGFTLTGQTGGPAIDPGTAYGMSGRGGAGGFSPYSGRAMGGQQVAMQPGGAKINGQAGEAALGYGGGGGGGSGGSCTLSGTTTGGAGGAGRQGAIILYW